MATHTLFVPTVNHYCGLWYLQFVEQLFVTGKCLNQSIFENQIKLWFFCKILEPV